MRARERCRVGKGAPLAFRRGHSVTRLCPFYAVLLCAFTLLPLGGKAQDLPPRAIRIVVPSPPGAAGDISARLIGQKLSEGLRQPVVVENQAGASGAIGMSMLRRAAPDGTTVGVVIALAQTITAFRTRRPRSTSSRTSRRSPRSPTTRRAWWSTRASRRLRSARLSI